MSIREFLDALRSTQGQHTLASVLEGPESGARLLLCEGVPVWPARPEGLLARNLPALAGCGASGILTLENKRIFVEKFGGAPRLVICGGRVRRPAGRDAGPARHQPRGAAGVR